MTFEASEYKTMAKTRSKCPNATENEDNEKHRKQFLSYFHDSKLPYPEKWPENSPVFVTASKRSPEIKYQLDESESDTQEATPFPLDGSVVSFSGPMFSGKIVSRIRDVPSMTLPSHQPPSCPSQNYFKGRSRQFQWTVQGSFSQRCRFDNVVTGQDLDRPFRNAPSSAIVKRGLDLLRNRLPETFEW